MKIKRFDPSKKKEGENVFYIQSHGFNAGKPLKKPIPNSWEIETNFKNAFEVCFVVFNSKILNSYIRGSVIPFLSLHEYKKIITPFLNNPMTENKTILKKLDAIQKLDLVLLQNEKQKKIYTEMKVLLSSEILKTLNAQ